MCVTTSSRPHCFSNCTEYVAGLWQWASRRSNGDFSPLTKVMPGSDVDALLARFGDN